METSDSRFKKRMQFESEKIFKLQQCAMRIFKAYLGQPRKVLRLIVFIACSITVLFQLAQCFKKLTNPPISTHSKVLINTTMSYPSITICRSPAYRKDVLKKYGLGSSLRWTSEWKNFPFGNTTLSAFWSEATYTHKDILSVYGLNRRTENIDVKSYMSYMGGQCHTLIPLVETYSSGTSAGYSLILKHTDPTASDAGWMVYIHEANEIWTASSNFWPTTEKQCLWTEQNFGSTIANTFHVVRVLGCHQAHDLRRSRWDKVQFLTQTGPQFSGMYEVFWVEADEEIDLKIVAHHIKTISQKDRMCVDKRSYSEGKCKSLCRWRLLAGLVGCTGPWMSPIGIRSGQKLGVKECDNYQDTRELIRQYMLQSGLSSYASWGYNGENDTEISANAFSCQSTCHRACHETQYTTFLMNRKTFSGITDARFHGNGVITPLDWVRGGGYGLKENLDELSRDDVKNQAQPNSLVKQMDCTGPGNCSERFERANDTKSSVVGSGVRVLCDGSSNCRGNAVLEETTQNRQKQPQNPQRRNSSEEVPVFGKVTGAAEATLTYSTLKVYYTSKVVSSMEEHWGYDFTQFVADAGGSLGFILGMSVVGAVAILEQLAETLVEAISGPKETLCEKDIQKTKAEGMLINSVVPYEGMKC